MTRRNTRDLLAAVEDGHRPSRGEALGLADHGDLDRLMQTAARLRDAAHGNIISFSRKVFIPLTRLCRDVCHYCVFARPPRRGERAYLTPSEVLDIARSGAAAGCREALFTLGDRPELRYRVAREELAEPGHQTTLSYLAAVARQVFDETGLLPHVNPGVMDAGEIAALRAVSVSQGMMLESVSERLIEEGLGRAWSRDGQHRDLLVGLEEATRRKGSGCLW